MLSQRKQQILGIIIGEYISTATPVASESIARRHGLKVSPATIRNEVAGLEEEGYISRPHVSAGSIPSDKGYRHYVESLAEEVELPAMEQRLIRHLFHQVEMETEQWVRLAASLLARMVQNVAIVTLPKAVECRFKHLELVALREFVALLILVLQEAKLKQQLLTFEDVVYQDELTTIANKLSSMFKGMASSQISAMRGTLSPLEQQIVAAVLRLMEAENEQDYEEPYLDGLRHILSQPEFYGSRKMLSIMEILEEKSLIRSLLRQVADREGVQVIIGMESREDAMHECSMVVTKYGIPGEVSGAIGVLGPRRMQYRRAISSVRYLSSVMSGLTAEVYQ